MERRSQPQTPATPDEIRARIRSEHVQIAAMLARVEALTERVGPVDPSSIVAVREELLALGDLLMEHLHYEEYQLPTLADEGTATEVAEAMRKEHEAQRTLLNEIIVELDETAVGTKLVTGVRELARAIRDDMEQEERELLSRLEQVAE